MNCIEVSTRNLNETLSATILKALGINALSFRIGESLNTIVNGAIEHLNITCSIICDTSVND